jgi:hypothetical protein
MGHSQYYHFSSRAQEGAGVVVLPAEGHNRIGCFIDQVKLIHALVQDLDKATKEIKLLGKHGEEASRKITELEALCRKHAKDAQKLREENTKLEGMVESCDKIIMEFVNKYGYNRMDEDTDDDDGGDATAPPVLVPPAATPEVIVVNKEDPVEMVPKQEAPEVHEVILVDAESKPPQPRLYTVLMRDYEESPSRMMDDLHELDDPIEADCDVDEWFPQDGSNDRD